MSGNPYHILVGVDIGLTCTGVAFCTTEMREPGIIKRWPGEENTINYKVPTAVEYRAGNRDIKSWGFKCPSPLELEPSRDVKDLFKLYLDENFLRNTFKDNPEIAVGTYEDVRYWYIDFLKALYQHIKDYTHKSFHEIADWKHHIIEFLFSYPTTWDVQVIAAFEQVVKDAGFETGGDRHTIKIHLTEAEAAAVYTADSVRQKKWLAPYSSSASVGEQAHKNVDLEEGNVVLVCDSGGGTTDVAVVKVASLKRVDEQDQEEGMLAKLELLGKANGIAIGSVQIDEAFREKLRKCLQYIGSHHPDIKIDDNVVDELVKRTFQPLKVKFGGNLQQRTGRFRITGLSENTTIPECNIESGRMMLSEDDLQEIFDAKLHGIFRLIDKQLEAHSTDQVTHLVLSGGLCSSEYVQGQLKKHYNHIQVLIAMDPQLAVCKGLVIDRLHQLKYDNFILTSCYPRRAYGIVSTEPVKKGKNSQYKKTPRKNPIDGKEYFPGRILWIVCPGEPVRRDEPIRHKFFRHVDICKGEMVWTDTIARSGAPTPDRLPPGIDDGDAEGICDIESTWTIENIDQFEQLDVVKRKQKRNILGVKTGKEFWRIEHDLLVSVRTTSLTFEIYLAGEKIGSRMVPVDFLLNTKHSDEDGEKSQSDESLTVQYGLIPWHWKHKSSKKP